MTQLLSTAIYRTKVFNINDKQYTIRFAVNKDETEYTMFVSNDTDKKHRKYHFSKEVADRFGKTTGEELKESVLAYIKSEIESGCV